MRSSRVLAAMLFVASCEKSAAPTTISTPPTDAKEPEAPATSANALCEALMPTAAGAWETAAQRRATLDRLIAQKLETECDPAAPADFQPDRRADETAYCRAAIMHEICKRDGERRRSLELRTRAFPTSADAWLALAMVRLGALRSDEGGSTVAITPTNRFQIADEAIETLQTALRVRPDDARAYALLAAAYDQRSLARDVVPSPRTRAQKKAAAAVKADRELARQAQQKACSLDPSSCATSPGADSCRTAPASPLALQIGAEKASAIQQAMQRGVVVVAFDCTDVVLLDSCEIEGRYDFVPRPRVDVDKRFTSRADVEAASPLWGTSTPPLRIEPGEVLSLKLVMVGQTRATKDRAAKTDLQGTCTGATHFVRAMHVGAFELHGTRGSENHEAKAGSLSECPTDTQRPSAQCRAPLQLELVPIGP